MSPLDTSTAASTVGPTESVSTGEIKPLQTNTTPINTLHVNTVGVVAIGRNEGERLVQCLHSLRTHLPPEVPIVYVDSGSTDNSVAEAKRQNVEVVVLDMSVPFTAARARSAGCDRLLSKYPDTHAVQFIDGDCEVQPGWMNGAVEFLNQNREFGVVFGRLRECFPEASKYNQLADMEWSVPVGEVKACGGTSLMRMTAYQQAGGFNPKLICGEEPELCIRMRRLGWRIQCIDVDMARHDMKMYKFAPWWKRSIRGGWAVAQGSAMYGQAPEKYKFKEHISGWVWGAILPLGAILTAGISHGVTLLVLFLLYGLQTFKIYQYRRKRGNTAKQSLVYAVFCVISKVPQAIGQGKYWLNRWRNKPAKLIEYKGNA
ncbi:MAG: glycosyltransferase [Cyanobacteria bacterium J06650_10]